jgi:glycosyltransferase involved in cell wall biosynthesis
MSHRPTILFIHFGASSFVKEDLRILGEFADLKVFHFKSSKSFIPLITSFIRQLYWLLKSIHTADLVYSWFSDHHSFFPTIIAKWFGIPVVTVLGGFDCNKIKSLNYGIFCSSWRAPLGRYVLRNSSLLLPVDSSLIQTNPKSKYWGEAHPNGVKENVPGFKNTWKSLPTGYDPNAWNAGPAERSRIVCTAALCSNHRTALIKGWDLFIEASKVLPEFEFKIVGAEPSFIPELKKKYTPGPNVEFIPPLPRKQLEKIYHQSSVYIQLSRAEGLPNVLCEAMMCGCVPVGSPVFGIPYGIGEAGYVAKKPDPEKIVGLIELAHQNAKTLRTNARQRIIYEFSLERRATKLKEIISTAI